MVSQPQTPPQACDIFRKTHVHVATTQDKECPLCCEDYDDVDHQAVRVDIHPCSHILCEYCLDQMILRRRIRLEANKCPFCRTVWFVSEYRKVTRRSRPPPLVLPAGRHDDARREAREMEIRQGLRSPGGSFPLPPGMRLRTTETLHRHVMIEAEARRDAIREAEARSDAMREAEARRDAMREAEQREISQALTRGYRVLNSDGSFTPPEPHPRPLPPPPSAVLSAAQRGAMRENEARRDAMREADARRDAIEEAKRRALCLAVPQGYRVLRRDGSYTPLQPPPTLTPPYPPFTPPSGYQLHVSPRPVSQDRQTTAPAVQPCSNNQTSITTLLSNADARIVAPLPNSQARIVAPLSNFRARINVPRVLPFIPYTTDQEEEAWMSEDEEEILAESVIRERMREFLRSGRRPLRNMIRD
jgi:Zn-finger nucleic acid-binding protein